MILLLMPFLLLENIVVHLLLLPFFLACVCVILLLMPIFLLEHIVVHLPLLPFFFVKLLCFTSTYFSLNLLLLIHEFINDS